MTIAPFGTWASPISAESLAKGAIGVADLRSADGRLFWLENRPDEGGRMVLMTADAGGVRPLTPEGFNVRTRVHEYGGAAYAVVGDTLYFAHFADQRLYAQPIGGAPTPLTPTGYRYADCVAAPDGGLIAVREDHTDPGEARNAIVALSGEADDAGRVLFGESDFVAYPRLSADGRRLAWMAWDHPNMPWDDTRLYVADLGADGLSNVQRYRRRSRRVGDGATLGGRRSALLHLRPLRFLEPVCAPRRGSGASVGQGGRIRRAAMGPGTIQLRPAGRRPRRRDLWRRRGRPSDGDRPGRRIDAHRGAGVQRHRRAAAHRRARRRPAGVLGR